MEKDFSLLGFDQAQQGFEKGRLSNPVGAKEEPELPFSHLEVDIFENDPVSIGHRQPVYLQDDIILFHLLYSFLMVPYPIIAQNIFPDKHQGRPPKSFINEKILFAL
jgi:hypothetical protein